MGRFGKSFLNDISNRLSNLLSLDGAVSADSSAVEKLLSVVLVGDATTPGYGRRARRFAHTRSLANGAVVNFQSVVDCVITDIQISSDLFAVLSTNSIYSWGAASAIAGLVQGGTVLDAALTSELGPLADGVSGAIGTLAWQQTLQAATQTWIVPVPRLGFFMPVGQRINVVMGAAGNVGRVVISGYVFN